MLTRRPLPAEASQRKPRLVSLGLVKPTWQEVLDREYEPWTRSRVLIDSFGLAVDRAVDRLIAEIVGQRRQV